MSIRIYVCFAMAIFAVVAPYLLFDHPHIVYAYGVASFGIWVAALDFHRRHRSEPVLGTSTERPREVLAHST